MIDYAELHKRILNIELAIDLGNYDHITLECLFDINQICFDVHERMNKKDYTGISQQIKKLVKLGEKLETDLSNLEASKNEANERLKTDLLAAVGWERNEQTEERWSFILAGHRDKFIDTREFVYWFERAAKIIDPL